MLPALRLSRWRGAVRPRPACVRGTYCGCGPGPSRQLQQRARSAARSCSARRVLRRAAPCEWTDLKATAKNALADADNYLTAHPTRYNPDRCYQLRADLVSVLIDGQALPIVPGNPAAFQHRYQHRFRGVRCPRTILAAPLSEHPPRSFTA